MKKFLVLYHAPTAAVQQTASVTPDQHIKGMEAWMNWAQSCGDRLLDLGAPLMNWQGQTTYDSPGVRNVSGYSILEAESIDEAKSMLEGHPHMHDLNVGCSIEVHETMQLPGM